MAIYQPSLRELSGCAVCTSSCTIVPVQKGSPGLNPSHGFAKNKLLSGELFFLCLSCLYFGSYRAQQWLLCWSNDLVNHIGRFPEGWADTGALERCERLWRGGDLEAGWLHLRSDPPALVSDHARALLMTLLSLGMQFWTKYCIPHSTLLGEFLIFSIFFFFLVRVDGMHFLILKQSCYKVVSILRFFFFFPRKEREVKLCFIWIQRRLLWE